MDRSADPTFAADEQLTKQSDAAEWLADTRDISGILVVPVLNDTFQPVFSVEPKRIRDESLISIAGSRIAA